METCISGSESVAVVGAWSMPRKTKRQWSAALKKELVMRMLRGEPLHGISREMSVPEYKLQRWRNCALVGIDLALRQNEADSLQSCLEEAHRRINELSLEVEQLRKRSRAKRSPAEMTRGSCVAEVLHLPREIAAS